MKAYSIDLREKIVSAYERGDTSVRITVQLNTVMNLSQVKMPVNLQMPMSFVHLSTLI